MNGTRSRLPKIAAVAALALGLTAGSYGIAAAASNDSGSGTGTTTSPGGSSPWGAQRSGETPLTGDALAKVTSAAKEKVPGGTVIRVETDADGNAAYEAHMTKADGTPVTVYVNKQFEVVSTGTR
jgi:hypothetical protein